MQCYYFLLLVFVMLTWDGTDGADVHFNVDKRDENTLSCNDGKTKNITVLEDEVITIHVAFYNESTVTKIKCTQLNDENKIYLDKPFDQASGLLSKMPPKQDMGMVKCTLTINKEGAKDINEKLIEQESHNNNFYADCTIAVHVRLSKTNQTILVNNMILPTTRTALEDENFDHTAIYYYAVGDVVKVSCILLEDNDSYNICMNYDYAEKLTGSYNKILQTANPLGYEFSTKLQTEHNNTVMVCTCKGLYDITKIKVTFIQKEFNDDGYIVFNGNIRRQDFENNSKIIDGYVFNDAKSAKVSCRSNKTDLSVGASCSKSVNENKQVYDADMTIPKVVCQLCNKREVVKTFEINIIPFPHKFTENRPLAVPTLPKRNIVFQLYDYKYGITWIHYEYDEGENITLQCQITRSAERDTKPNMKYEMNGKDIKENETITLTSAHDGVIFKCHTKDNGNLTVKFSQKKAITGVLIDIDDVNTPLTNSMKWIIGVVCGLICIILLCIAIIIYKRSQQRAAIPKRRNDNKQILPSNDNVNSINDVQDDTYANLLKIQNMASKNNNAVNSQDGSYANLSIIKNTATRNDDKTIYSEPVNVQGDTYANLSKLQNRAAKNDDNAADCGPVNAQDVAYANFSKLQDEAGKYDKKAINFGPTNIRDGSYANLLKDNENIICRPANKEYDYYDQLQNRAETPDMNYAELNIDPLNSPTPNKTEIPYVEVREMYAQVLPKSARKNQNSYDNVVGNVRYINSKNSEYVEPTYCQAYKK